jgi:hypothetical protein
MVNEENKQINKQTNNSSSSNNNNNKNYLLSFLEGPA